MITPLGFDQQRTPVSAEDRARTRRFSQMIREADRVCARSSPGSASRCWRGRSAACGLVPSCWSLTGAPGVSSPLCDENGRGRGKKANRTDLPTVRAGVCRRLAHPSQHSLRCRAMHAFVSFADLRNEFIPTAALLISCSRQEWRTSASVQPITRISSSRVMTGAMVPSPSSALASRARAAARVSTSAAVFS
jgi:hypothetical protein